MKLVNRAFPSLQGVAVATSSRCGSLRARRRRVNRKESRARHVSIYLIPQSEPRSGSRARR